MKIASYKCDTDLFKRCFLIYNITKWSINNNKKVGLDDKYKITQLKNKNIERFETNTNLQSGSGLQSEEKDSADDNQTSDSQGHQKNDASFTSIQWRKLSKERKLNPLIFIQTTARPWGVALLFLSQPSWGQCTLHL